MKSISQIVGENLERERSSRGLSQADVAKSLSVKPLTVYRWENGRAWPTEKNIEALAKLFDVEASSFFIPREPSKDPKVKAALITICRAFGYGITGSKGK